MTTEIQNTNMSAVESALVTGDLAKLSTSERINYYQTLCRSLGLNPLTKPFEYITLNNKLTLYARKDATDQLRNIRGISIGKPDIQFHDSLIIVAVEAHDAKGRTDSDIGVVNKSDMRGDLSNVLMKAVTKAKRRVTLSICGLGMLDETEVETIPDAKPFIDNPNIDPVIPVKKIEPPQSKRDTAMERIVKYAKELDAHKTDEAVATALTYARAAYTNKNASLETLFERGDELKALVAAYAQAQMPEAVTVPVQKSGAYE